jgi:hypothetical protein
MRSSCARGPAIRIWPDHSRRRRAHPGIVKGGADDLVADRMELGARLLEGELHRACPLHAVGREEGRGDARPDDQQAVVAEDHDVAIAEIGEEARAFLRASGSALAPLPRAWPRRPMKSSVALSFGGNCLSRLSSATGPRWRCEDIWLRSRTR